ncbi:N(2)-acetyl-L-2,4-diaminobutanoate deacetylase DoeB2 [Pseudohaliea rubra]|uniref:N(2)-acetyl-L-2,4-diaminobutanoate deacetylase DoeB2 n=1 Tax=Pseudohaliea rubra TaxID=475795 RepID=UPI001F4098A8|nr:N(2)-acetyl-L-2,4-diaminobutanoate deacetylase DoeB2 [Pseudohaliea rubra]
MARAIELRRVLHAEPELTWAEHDTAARVRAILDDLGLAWRPCAETGTVATLAPDAPGRHLALRADLDALPITEQTALPWHSRRDGCMHACGHDGHTATLVAAALWLARVQGELPGPVTLLFQPAEEGGHGARRMIADGALDDVDAVFGWHNWPAIPFGQAACPDGVVMAGNGTYRLTLRGAGGHASQPELCRDPVLASAAVVQALQQVVSRRLPAQAATVLSVTSIDARSTPTVIPDNAVIEGSFRIADDRDRARLGELMTEIASGTAAGYGVGCEVELFPRYGPTVNHAREAACYRGALAAEFGPGVFSGDTRLPIMASEDFSYYLRERPGAFALVGAGGEESCHQVPCHSARYDFNDALIAPMARVYARLVGAPLPGAMPPQDDNAKTEERQ